MNKLLTLLVAGYMTGTVAYAQKPAAAPNPVQPFGKIDKADLELTSCDFEKDANAMVLFEKGDVYYDQTFNIILDVQRRIKIFNDNGKGEANIKINYLGGNRYEYITGVEAVTYNLNNGKVEVTKLDKKQLFTQIIDKNENQITFSFPNVKPGSVIEFKYRKTINDLISIPAWSFQDNIPVKYSEIDTSIPDFLYFRTKTNVWQSFVKNTTSSETKAGMYSNDIHQLAMANIHSLPEEPFMTSKVDNIYSINYVFTQYRPVGGFQRTFVDTWPKVGEFLADDEDFGSQLKRKLTNEETIINKAKTLKTDAEKIAYVFGEVKNTMKWNESDRWYTSDGTRSAWDKKAGNSAEINIILYHLLKSSGLNAYPMVVSTRDHGKVNPVYPFINQFNRTVVYIPVDSTKRYVLDATSKYNMYNEIPSELLNSYGLYVDKDQKVYDLVYLEKTAPTRKVVFVNAEIKPDGQMSGDASVSCYGYNRINAIKAYQTDGEKKFIENISEHDNALKISSLKMENMEVDSLPLNENMQFKLDLSGSDGNYIYFSSNIFTSLHTNPFISEERFTNIDFGYLNTISVSGVYKLPTGYKADALPKSVSMVMPDQSISFKRIIAEQEGTVVVRYVIDYKKALYFRENYPDLHEFYKKMHEMLSEQIVLKKS